jgi:Arc/MetJ-type ribon-helix-helix transcriptional regulator
MVRVITFKVSDEFYEKYLANVENKSEFIRYAIESLYRRIGEDKDYEALIDIVNSVGRWKLKIWKPLEENAKGRYVTYEVITDKKYKVFQRYIRVETLRKIYDVVRDAIEELVLNYHRDPEKLGKSFRKSFIELD